MKKTACIALCIVLALSSVGCGANSISSPSPAVVGADEPRSAAPAGQCYRVTIDDAHASVCEVGSAYCAGETVTIRLDKATGRTYALFVDGEEIFPSTDSADDFICFEFPMPDKDVQVVIEDRWVCPPDNADTIGALVNAFEENGFAVKVELTESQFLRGRPFLLSLSGISDGCITVYQYEDSAQAQNDVLCIDDSGSTVYMPDQTIYITWKAIPFFYWYDDVIIQYVGTDDTILNLLAELFGDPFAGGFH